MTTSRKETTEQDLELQEELERLDAELAFLRGDDLKRQEEAEIRRIKRLERKLRRDQEFLERIKAEREAEDQLSPPFGVDDC